MNRFEHANQLWKKLQEKDFKNSQDNEKILQELSEIITTHIRPECTDSVEIMRCILEADVSEEWKKKAELEHKKSFPWLH